MNVMVELMRIKKGIDKNKAVVLDNKENYEEGTTMYNALNDIEKSLEPCSETCENILKGGTNNEDV